MNMNKKLLLFLVFIILTLTTTTVFAATYIGNKNSDIFHTQSCTYISRMNNSNKIYFNSYDEAISFGMRPCKKCISAPITSSPNSSTYTQKSYINTPSTNTSVGYINKIDNSNITFEKIRNYYLGITIPISLLFYVFRVIKNKEFLNFNDFFVALCFPILLVPIILLLPFALFEKFSKNDSD